MKLLITGGAGFIGSAVIRYILNRTEYQVINLDALTYAGNLASLPNMNAFSGRYKFERCDIRDLSEVKQIFQNHQPDAVMHLAAESHVDRAIDDPSLFIQTNIIGTFNLLHVARQYFHSLSTERKSLFRFHHVSTDEVYGDLPDTKARFTEETAYSPNNPYSATKAGSDHLTHAWGRTYGLPVILTNCSNNYGSHQFPEKLIPHMILNALKGKPLPIYGSGQQIRDWLYVEDHARALIKVITTGITGETYNIGANNQKTNLEVVGSICQLLEEFAPDKPEGVNYYQDLICHVDDRAGHDARYAIDASKIQRELNWKPNVSFEEGLRKTVRWYLDNESWWQAILSGEYQLNRLRLTQ